MGLVSGIFRAPHAPGRGGMPGPSLPPRLARGDISVHVRRALGRSAPKLGLPGPEAVEAVRQVLQDRDGWLLVFDNVTDPRDLQPYRPAVASGRVLVTSRHPGWGGLGSHVQVDLFTRMESVLLLQRRIPELAEQVALAKELADELGDLPLALEQAAGYIESNGTDPQRYLELFRSAREQLLSEGAVPDHVLLDATWQVSLDQLQQDDAAAVQLLRHVAFLAADPFSGGRSGRPGADDPARAAARGAG